MRKLLSIGLLFLSLTSFGQAPTLVPGLIRRPTLSGAKTLNINSDGKLIVTPKSGSSIFVQVDSSGVVGLGRKQALQDAALLVRPMQFNLGGLRGFAGSSSIAPKVVNLTTKGYAGTFVRDSLDATSPDDGGLIFVTTSGLRYKRVLDGPINAREHFNVKGNGSANDTALLQAALNATARANDPQTFGAYSPSNGFSNTLYIPHGVYNVYDELLVKGSMTIQMDRASSYGGTRIIQKTAGKHLFHIVKDTDGGSSGVQFYGGILLAGAATNTPGTALIYGGESSADGNNNSTYIDNVWFRTSEDLCVYIKRGDDVHIRNCTMDVHPFHAIKLGSATNKVTNASITGNTLFDIRAGVIEIVNGENINIADNRVYYSAGSGFRIPYFVWAVGQGTKGLSIHDNLLEGVNWLAYINELNEDTQVANNIVRIASGKVIAIGGGQTVTGLSLTNNSMSGDFSTDSPVASSGTGLSKSNITGNTFRNTGSIGTTSTPLLIPDSRSNTNVIANNLALNFAIAAPTAGVNVALPALTPTYSTSMSTTGWTTSTYNQLVAPGVLTDNTIYLLRLAWVKSGVDNVSQVIQVPICITASGSTPVVLTGNTATYTGGSRAFVVRLKPGTGTWGLETTINTADMAGGTLTVSLTPLL